MSDNKRRYGRYVLCFIVGAACGMLVFGGRGLFRGYGWMWGPISQADADYVNEIHIKKKAAADVYSMSVEMKPGKRSTADTSTLAWSRIDAMGGGVAKATLNPPGMVRQQVIEINPPKNNGNEPIHLKIYWKDPR